MHKLQILIISIDKFAFMLYNSYCKQQRGCEPLRFVVLFFYMHNGVHRNFRMGTSMYPILFC